MPCVISPVSDRCHGWMQVYGWSDGELVDFWCRLTGEKSSLVPAVRVLFVVPSMRCAGGWMIAGRKALRVPSVIAPVSDRCHEWMQVDGWMDGQMVSWFID
eukprot:TRINITY_DN4283_c0_g1_i7.p1 TRINITY_DN4283_c0_g1~~TRINITY_DN4283_c0_g1_i7.p1  ORF type:complete len:101 (-),score=7.46 TRINITY_DN4283_c0_g1_i7:208-510(-)